MKARTCSSTSPSGAAEDHELEAPVRAGRGHLPARGASAARLDDFDPEAADPRWHGLPQEQGGRDLSRDRMGCLARHACRAELDDLAAVDHVANYATDSEARAARAGSASRRPGC